MAGSIAARIVRVRSAAEIPVVTPSRASTDSQKAVPKFEVFCGEINGRRYLSRQSVETMTRVFTPDVIPSGWLGGTGYGLTFEIVNQPQGTLLLHSPGTFGHGGAFGTEGWIDPKNDLIRIILVQVSDGAGDAPRSVVMQIGEAAVQ